jgi:HPt (histidine-containing phosphotransfer) domain-containing protein
LGKVIEAYLTDAPRLLRSVQEAVARADGEVLRKAAHSLKSSSATLGAQRLSSLCKELESMGRGESLEKATALFSETKIEFETVQNLLKAELKRRMR